MKQKLKILMLTEYFYPHTFGGSEQSTYHLAKSLIKRGHQVTVLTPNYGAPTQETWQGIHIFRGHILIQLINLVRREHPNIIHIQSKAFIPIAVIVSKVFNLPTVLTVRDYYLICPLGFCLWEKPRGCSWSEFLSRDIPTYAKFYPTHALSPLLHLSARLMSQILRYFTRQVDQIVCISQAQKQIFTANGFHHLKVIYNTTDFPRTRNRTRTNQIIFVGRLTPGKGADLLVSLANKLPPSYELIVVGSGFLATKIRHSRIILTGQIDYQQVLKLYRQVKLAIFPSRWPEPFGRGALEAIAADTPVVTSNRGALPEIVQDKYGLSVEPTPAKLAQALDHIITHYHRFTAAIAKDRSKLIYRFNTHPVSQYEKFYSRCLA